MYKKILCLFVVFILLFSCFTFISQCEDTKPTTRRSSVLEVGADMPYQSIQEAINASEPGDTIYVHSGIYTEPLNITKSITLIGADKEITAISLNEYWPNGNINITTNGVTIKNFTINRTRHGYGMTGIRLFGVKNCILRDNIISVGYSNGIHIYNSKNITIENNTIFYNWRAGILIESSEYITIKNNTIFENEEFGIALVESNNNLIMNNNISSHYWNGLNLENSSNNLVVNNNISQTYIGIRIIYSRNNTLQNNTLLGNGFVIRGEELDHWNSHDIDESNMVNGKTFYYWKDRTNGTVPPNAGQIILANCSNILVKNQNLSYCSESIIMGFSDNNRLINNSINGWWSSRHGVVLYRSANNIIANNSCFWHYYFGIYLNFSNGNILKNNICMENGKGIFIVNSDNNVIINNSVALNSGENLELVNSNNIELINNNFTSYVVNYQEIRDELHERNVVFRYSKNLTLENNTMTYSGINIYGDFEHWNSHSIDNTNTVNGKPIYYYKNQDSQQVSMELGELILANCTNMIIKNIKTSYICSGILVGYSSNINISNNTFMNNYNGIQVFSSNNNVIEYNYCFNNSDGILLDGSNGNIIRNNYCIGNNEEGIALIRSEQNTITNNICKFNFGGIWLSGAENNMIINNTCDSNHQNGLMFWESEFNTIVNNKCINNSNGIRLYNSKNSTIINNTCKFNRNHGIELEYSGYIILQNNTLNANEFNGIRSRWCNNCTIINNSINFNNRFGIEFSQYKDGEIDGNILYRNNQANIWIYWSNNINISNNDIVLSNYTGISLLDSSNNTIFWNNIISNGNSGISIDRNSKYNTIHSNNIMNFGYQVTDDSEHNSWNLSYPGGGNYWGGYQGLDNFKGPAQDTPGSDSFGDKPYSIPGGPGGTFDFYPLMEPTASFKSLKIPLAPLNLTIIPYEKSVVLSWSSPIHTGDSNITHYNIYRNRFDEHKELIAIVENGTTYVDYDIREKWVYYYNVTAENDFGEGPSSDDINITPVFKPKKSDQNILNTLNPLRCAMGIILIILAIVFLINMILTKRRLKKNRELEKTEIKIDTDKKDRMDK